MSTDITVNHAHGTEQESILCEIPAQDVGLWTLLNTGKNSTCEQDVKKMFANGLSSRLRASFFASIAGEHIFSKDVKDVGLCALARTVLAGRPTMKQQILSQAVLIRFGGQDTDTE